MAADGPRREPTACGGAVLGMFGWIHVQEVADVSLFWRCALFEDGQARCVEEALGLLRNPDDFGTSGDGPEADAARQVEPVHGRFLAELLPGGVGVAVGRVGIWADDVEAV